MNWSCSQRSLLTRQPLAAVNEGIQRITASIIRFGLVWRGSPQQTPVNSAENPETARGWGDDELTGLQHLGRVHSATSPCAGAQPSLCSSPSHSGRAGEERTSTSTPTLPLKEELPALGEP